VPETKTKPETRQVWDMALQGLSSREIAEELGLKVNTVANMILRGRAKGVVPRRTEDDMSVRYRLKKANTTLGSMMAIFDSLSTEQRAWLVKQSIDCGCATISEFVVELVRDAYEEDKSKKETSHE